MEVECAERLTKVEERAKSNSHRLEKLEPIVEEIHTMSKTMVQLVEEVKYANETVGSLNDKVEKMDNRVDDMEKAPAIDFKSYKNSAITAIISALAGMLVSGLLFVMTNYIK